jgi:hypothetical protein
LWFPTACETIPTVQNKRRLIIGLVIAVVLVVVWLELAVGVFGTPWAGS